MRALLVVGSRARAAPPADGVSDLDLILFVRDASALVADGAWLSEMGEVWLARLQQTGRGDPEWISLFAGGLKVDWVLVTVPPQASTLAEMVRASPYAFVYRRGVRVLLDKSDSFAPLPDLGPEEASHPAPADLEDTLAQAWLLALRVAKGLRRGEVWQANRLLAGPLHGHLLTLITWHARAHPGLPNEIWHDGRWMERWADPRAVAALPATVAPCETAAQGAALGATLSLMHWLARETAERLGYPYPAQREAQMMAWLQRLGPGGTDPAGL